MFFCLSVLGDVTAAKLREVGQKIMPNKQQDQQQGTNTLATGSSVAATETNQKSFTSALQDVSQHVGESLKAHVVEPIVNKYHQLQSKDGSSSSSVSDASHHHPVIVDQGVIRTGPTDEAAASTSIAALSKVNQLDDAAKERKVEQLTNVDQTVNSSLDKQNLD